MLTVKERELISDEQKIMSEKDWNEISSIKKCKLIISSNRLCFELPSGQRYDFSIHLQEFAPKCYTFLTEKGDRVLIGADSVSMVIESDELHCTFNQLSDPLITPN